MPKKLAPNMGLPYGWLRGEDFWGGPMNEALTTLDTAIHLTLKSITFSAPPADAKEGDRFYIYKNPTGPWAGHENEVAVLIDGAWKFIKPRKGWRALLDPTDEFLWFNGDDWIIEKTGVNPIDPDPDPQVVPMFYDVAVTVSDEMYPGEPLVHLPILNNMYVPANFAGSALDSIEAFPRRAVFNVLRNGQQVGTMVVEYGQYSAKFSTVGGSAVRFFAGDRLTISAPVDTIPRLKNFGFIIRFNL